MSRSEIRAPTPPAVEQTGGGVGGVQRHNPIERHSLVLPQKDETTRPRGGYLIRSGGGNDGDASKNVGVGSPHSVTSQHNKDVEDDAMLLTTTETLSEGKVYLNEHPRRARDLLASSEGGISISEVVSGTIPFKRGAFANSTNMKKQMKEEGSAQRSSSKPITLGTAREDMLPAAGVERDGGESERTNASTYSLGLHPEEASHIVFGSSGTVTASVSCNIDHDDNLVKKIVVAYAQRQLQKLQPGRPTLLVEERRGAPTSSDIVDDLFMRSIMSVTKLTDVPAAKGAGPSRSRRPMASVIVPTKIPINHWVLRETLYESRGKSGKNSREDATVFNDLRQNKRSVVFPSNNPNNRPEVYYLAQTLDVMFASIPDGYRTLASGDECYRILEPVAEKSCADPLISGEEPAGADSIRRDAEEEEVFPPASTRYYEAAAALWEVLDAGFTEVSRQISPVCSERAALLEALRTVAKDVGATGLEVMQFCKEEMRSLLQRESDLEKQVSERDRRIAELEALVEELRAREEANAADLANFEELKARYEAVRQQVHVGTAMLVRDKRLADVLAAMDSANSASYASGQPRASSAQKSATDTILNTPPGLETNPHLALLASGVAGIDIDAVKTIVKQMDEDERRRCEEDNENEEREKSIGMHEEGLDDGASLIIAASSGARGKQTMSSGGFSGSSPRGGGGGVNDESSPETYHEAIKYLLTLDEAVRAIDVACLPFYQRALFNNPSLCVSVASGKWRGIAKAIGRHEMILEQREKQWREAVRHIRREEEAADLAVASGIDVTSVGSNNSTSQHKIKIGGGASLLQQGEAGGPADEGTVMEQQMAFMHQFRSSTRRLLGAAFGIRGTVNKSNLDGFDDADSEDERDAGSAGGRSRVDGADLVIGSRTADPTSKANAEAFLNAKLMLPATYSIGRNGIAAMLKDTRAVMIEIVQRLCALATSAQLKELTKPPMLPPSEPHEPCPLCHRIHVAELQRRRRDEAMAKLLEETEVKEKAHKAEMNTVKKELDEANAKIARSLKLARDAQTRSTALEKQLNQQGKELQVLKEWGGGGVSASANRSFGRDRFSSSAIDDSGDFVSVGGRGSIVKINKLRRQTEPSAADELREDGEDEVCNDGDESYSSPTTRRAKGLDQEEGVEAAEDDGSIHNRRRSPRRPIRPPAYSPVVVELVINCSCCGGGGGGGATRDGNASDQRNAMLLKSQQLIVGTSPTKGEGGQQVGKGKSGGAFARLVSGYSGVGAAAATGSVPGAALPEWLARITKDKEGRAAANAPPSNPAELLEAIAFGIDVSSSARGLGFGGKGILTPSPPSMSGAGGGINTVVSMRQAQAALGIKKKQSPFTIAADTGAPANGGQASSAESNTRGVGAGGDDEEESPVIKGVSDLLLYDAKAEERAKRKLGNSQQEKSKAFWGYIGKALGAGGNIGGRKDDDPPEVFPTNPQYAKVKSKLATVTKASDAYSPLSRGGHDSAKAGIYYPRPLEDGAAAVVSNLLTEEENAQAAVQLRPALGLEIENTKTMTANAKRRAPKSLGWLLRFAAQFYKSKLFADLVTMYHRPRIAKDGSGLQTPIAYLQTMLRNMYGHKSVVKSTLEDLVLACASYQSVDPRVAQFVRFLTDTTTLPNTEEKAALSSNSDDERESGPKQPISEASRSLFFFSRLSRAVDNCTVGLNYATSTATFCSDDDQTALQIVSLARLQGVLQQTQLVKKPYAAALWDVICSSARIENVESFRATQVRNGYTLLQGELHPKDWSEDDVKRARMTCPKIIFLVAATQFEAILREQLVAEPDTME